MQIHSKRRKRSNSARKRKHMELRAIASFACKVRVQDLGTRMKRAWSNERRHRSFSLVYVSPKWNFYKLKSFSQNSLYFTSFVRSGRITGPVSIFIMGHFVIVRHAPCAIRAWRTAFLIPEKDEKKVQYFVSFCPGTSTRHLNFRTYFTISDTAMSIVHQPYVLLKPWFKKMFLFRNRKELLLLSSVSNVCQFLL